MVVVDFSFDFFADTGETAGDFAQLLNELIQSGAADPNITFNLGVAQTGAGEFPNAMAFLIPSARVLGNAEVFGSEKVVRTISGRGVRSGTTGFGSAANEEFRLTAI